MIKARRGFTLIEILVATSIFSVVILSLYSAFRTGILSYNRIDSAFNIYQTARILFNRMEADLKNSFIYSESNSQFQGSSSTLEFFSVIDSFSEGKRVENVCRIRYYLEEDALKRASQQGLGALEADTEIQGVEIASNIKEVLLQYASSKDVQDRPFDWFDSWPQESDPDSIKNFPIAVRIKLQLIEKDKADREIGLVEFNKIVWLPLSRNENEE